MADRLGTAFVRTVEHMRAGVPVIEQAVLRNPKTRTHGIADLLVRADMARDGPAVSSCASALIARISQNSAAYRSPAKRIASSAATLTLRTSSTPKMASRTAR